MPRISAATVAEHRAAQHRALLDAARDLLAADPTHLPSLAEVGALAGLARPSVYQYFRSRDELLIAVLADAFPRWSDRVTAAMDREPDPVGRVLAYVTANLELVAAGEHAMARTLTAAIESDQSARSRTLHDQLRLPLVAALTACGAPDPAATAELVDGIVHAATRMVENGADPARVTERAAELVSPFLLSLPGSDSGS
ncbi:TetR/AcrR family transcriptional regulator [Nocardia stercoris]|uniref:TetR/AcrR family transcriptional regulator n=1 Tax=Nocardia stercoris TaxID=2483361 RepID=A0A3M2L510_9NOCA|nr:TetR/AcrR family transcriptional regulator [Nocardia stercoris]RMI32737.1 TetR/AcrR family transcriptional regulator [Nocardia stercoris]